MAISGETRKCKGIDPSRQSLYQSMWCTCVAFHRLGIICFDISSSEALSGVSMSRL